MKIAVIGANGFVGSRLVEQLHLAQEHTVIPIVRSSTAFTRTSRFKLECRVADALDRGALRAALAGCDAVVHAASGQGRELERMSATLCTAAADAGIRRLVYVSCASVHGLCPEPGSNEHSPLHTTGAPAETAHRIMAERAFFDRCERSRLEGIALRPGIIYGPRSWWFVELAAALREGRAWWFGEGRGIFNGIYVDNLTSAIFSALAAPAGVTNKPYLVGDEETVTWREFYVSTAKRLGVSSRRITSITELPPAAGRSRARPSRSAGLPRLETVAPAVPAGVKRFAKYLWPVDEPVDDGWAPRLPPGPAVTREAALLQQCQWRFPHKRAAHALGFHAPVTLSEGLRRTLDWLAFSEGESPRPPAGSSTEGAARTTRQPF